MVVLGAQADPGEAPRGRRGDGSRSSPLPMPRPREGDPTNRAQDEHDEVRCFSAADALQLYLALDSYGEFTRELDDSR